jgi:hypothetical protein
MDGLGKMLSFQKSYILVPQVAEILFWQVNPHFSTFQGHITLYGNFSEIDISSRTDLFASASTHQPMRNYTAKPNIRQACLPLNCWKSVPRA